MYNYDISREARMEERRQSDRDVQFKRRAGAAGLLMVAGLFSLSPETPSYDDDSASTSQTVIETQK